MKQETLQNLSKEIRREVLTMVYRSKSGHLGCSLGIVDILIALYFEVLHINPKRPALESRDIFLLSKGHAAATLYATLSKRDFFPKSYLSTYFQDGSKLAGHVTLDSLPGIEGTAGSLGHGLSIGIGMAIAIKSKNLSSKVYVLIGDGECAEGSIWEAINFAGHNRIDNLILILDNNDLQIMGRGSDILNSLPFADKFTSFGWDVKVVNGHNISQLTRTLKIKTSGKPLVIIANTVKGKGVSFMENKVEWHGKCPSKEEYLLAIKELS